MNKNHHNQLFDNFLHNNRWNQARQYFDVLLGHPVWWIFEPSGKKTRLLEKPGRAVRQCPGLTKKVQKGSCSFLQGFLKKTDEWFRQERFYCQAPYQVLIYPLRHNRNFYGAVLICCLEEDILKNKELLGLFKITIDSILEETQKQTELNRLYETLRPRAVALSTVHIIHRIIGTTMTINELLPKVGRLCLQILKARACSIWLYDKEKNKLVPRVSIGTKEKELKLGEGIIGKVAETGNYHWEDKILSVPLQDEDIVGCITVYGRRDNKPFSIPDQEILLTLAEQATIAIENARLYEEQQKMVIGSVKSLARILDFISPKTYTHSGRFVDLVMAIAGEMKLSPQDKRTIYYAAVLHDAGKLGISEDILGKTDKLSRREIKIIRSHPTNGVSIIEPIGVLKPLVPLVLHHHERYNGRGYPDGLSGEQIPLGARIMAVVDTFEAMISKRPYRAAKSLSLDDALTEIKKCSGTQFDPEVVKAFMNLYKKGILHQLLRKNRKG